MRVLVTGGGGFLGGAIVRQLLERGDEVTSISRGDYPHLRELGVRTLRGDLADEGVAREAVVDHDAVVHAAALAGVWGDAEDYRRANVVATERVVDACVAQDSVHSLVFTSSPSVTFGGEDEEGTGPEAPYPGSYMAHYPRTKAAAERYALAANGPALRVTSLRPHLIWGPGDPHLVPRLIRRGRAGKLKIVGEGTNRVDLTYVDNAAVAHLQALDALAALEDAERAPAGRAYFISDDDPVVLWDWINDLFERVGLEPVRRRVPRGLASLAGAVLETAWRALPLDGEPPMTRFVAAQLATSHWFDIEPARRDFGYAPIVDPEEGLEAMVDDLRDRGLV
jgi:nucleoside-diphosphate-sugar epimerase